MPLNVGAVEAAAVYVGNTAAAEIYVGTTLVWSVSETRIWESETAYPAYENIELPTGRIGFVEEERTSGTEWDATEESFWTVVESDLNE